MAKPTIEAIYPLTAMQEALLMHNLQSERDEGFLQLHITLSGPLDIPRWRKAWDEVVERHAVLRSSIHWKKIEKPVQVQLPQSNIPWEVRDLQHLSPPAFDAFYQQYLSEDREKGMDLSRSPLTRMALFQKDKTTFQVLWSCHHILLDGWSAGILLREAFQLYDALSQGKFLQQANVPNYKAYLRYIQQADLGDAATFWKAHLKDLQDAPLLNQGSQATSFREKGLLVAESWTAQIQQNRLTTNSFFHGIWSLLLARYFQVEDLVFGTTVSGRTSGIPGMDEMTGLFMNVLPLRATLTPGTSFAKWLQRLQADLLKAREHEFVSQEQVFHWSNRSTTAPLFDSLLVFENFPWENLSGAGVRLTDFKGAITTTYPLSIIIIPGSDTKVILRFAASIIPEDVIDWMIQSLKQLIMEAGQDLSLPVDVLLHKMPDPPITTTGTSVNSGHSLTVDKPAYIAPRNVTELSLVSLWEGLLNRHPIGMQDDFFHLGGNSRTAVRLFAAISQKFGQNLPPITLLQHRTIEQLAMKLNYGDPQKEQSFAWSSLVPLRASGAGSPLFCIHAGGAHVFIYNALAHYLSPDIPVYGIQPKGLDGRTDPHSSIEVMARDYIREMRSVQPNGPLRVLGYCFSIAVCLEIGRQELQASSAFPSIIIVDSGPWPWFRKYNPAPGKAKRVLNFAGKILSGAWDEVGETLRSRIDKPGKVKNQSEEERQEHHLQQITNHLDHLYRHYHWKPVEGIISLIRSREFVDRTDKNFHIEGWSALAKGGVKTHIVQGHHQTLFEAPEVRELAGLLDLLLTKSQEV